METQYLKATDFYSSIELVDNYQNYVSESYLKKIKLGFPIMDNLTRGLRPKEVMTLIAGTGIGKSALTQNILMNHARETNELTLYFTLEMSSEEIFERMIQIKLKVSGYEVENEFLNKNEKFIQSCKEVAREYKDFILIEKRIDINILNNVIKFIEDYFNRKAGLICIDHLLLLENVNLNANEYLKVSDNMKKLKSFALENKYPVMVISQVSRNDGKNGIDLFSGKGSGEVENSSNFVLGLEKINATNCDNYGLTEGLINEYDMKHISILAIRLLKNRRGKCGACIIEMDRKTLKMTESILNHN